MNASTDNIIYSVFLLCSAVGLTNIPLKQDALDVWIRTQTFFLNVLLGPGKAKFVYFLVRIDEFYSCNLGDHNSFYE